MAIVQYSIRKNEMTSSVMRYNTGAPLCAEGRRTPMHNIGAVTAVMAVRADALLKVTQWELPFLSTT